MATLLVPRLDDEPWPTLGPQIVDWMEAHLPYGPGALMGEPYKVEPEFAGWLYRSFEVYPQWHERAGQRRFGRVCWNVRKGGGKTEKLAAVAAAELHPTGPVRCDGFDAHGNPVGVGVHSPYVGLVAYEKGQVEELGYAVLSMMLERSDLASDFDIGLERILLLDHMGRPIGRGVPLSGSPGARDGGKPTFYGFDETHRQTTPNLRAAHQTMMNNVYKIKGGYAWALETTTMFDPAEESVASNTHAYAVAVDEGRIKDSRLFYFYRHAPLDMPLETPEQVKDALVEASGPVADWSGDLDALSQVYFEPGTDQQYYRRVWLNQLITGQGRAFDVTRWAELADPAHVVPDRAQIALGFDGAKTDDGTALVAVELATGYAWVAGYWQAPEGDDEWQVDPYMVEQVVDYMFSRYRVERMYGDPFWWVTEMDRWRGKHGDKKVISFATTSLQRTGLACMSLAEAIKAGQIAHGGDSLLTAHVGNAIRQDTKVFAEDGQPIWVIRKDRRGSPRKIDAAMALVLALQARNDAIAAGALKRGSHVARSWA